MRTFKFHRIIPEQNIDKWENVQEEKWQWLVIYKDGTVLRQFDDTHPLSELGENVFLFHQFQEVDHDNAQIFQMYSPLYQHKYTIILPEGAKPIHYYINSVFALGTPDQRRVRAYVFGYEIKSPTGRTIKKFHVITPDDELVITDDVSQVVFE